MPQIEKKIVFVLNYFWRAIFMRKNLGPLVNNFFFASIEVK